MKSMKRYRTLPKQIERNILHFLSERSDNRSHSIEPDNISDFISLPFMYLELCYLSKLLETLHF